MEADLGETTNVAGRHPEVVEALQKAYDRFWADAKPHMANDIHPLAAGELGNEPFRQLYLKTFGADAYAARRERMEGWKKGGQPEKDFEAHPSQKN
jgi:hypothetical protein